MPCSLGRRFRVIIQFVPFVVVKSMSIQFRILPILLLALTLCSVAGFCADPHHNGFAVLYPVLRTYGSIPALEKECCAELKIGYPVEQKKVLVPFSAFEKERFPNADSLSRSERLIEWYKEYGHVVDVLREALQCPVFRAPEPAALIEARKNVNVTSMFFGAATPKTRTPYDDFRELQNLLHARVYAMAEENKYDEFFDTFLLLNQFGIAVSDSSDARFRLLGASILGSSWHIHNDLFRAGTLSAEWYRDKLKILTEMKSHEICKKETPIEYHYQFLEEIRNNHHSKNNLFAFEQLRRSLSKDTGGLIEADAASEREKTVNEWYPKIDWDVLKQMVQPWSERINEVEKLLLFRERYGSFKQIEVDLQTFADKHPSPKTSAPAELAAAVIFPQILSACLHEDEIITRNNAIGKMLLIHYAIAAYHAEHKKYPESLVDMLCEELPKLPDDPFTKGKPFGYRTFEGGCVVYSVGVNGTLDGEGKKFSALIGLPDDARVRNLFWDSPGDDIGFFQLNTDFDVSGVK